MCAADDPGGLDPRQAEDRPRWKNHRRCQQGELLRNAMCNRSEIPGFDMVDWLKVPVLTAAVDKMKTAKKPKLDRDYVLRCVLLTLCAHVTHTCPVSDSSWVAGTRRSTSRPLLMPWSSTASAMPTAPRPRAVPASPRYKPCPRVSISATLRFCKLLRKPRY